MSGPCGFRYSNEWHEVYVCERPGTLQPEGGFRCPQHDRHEIRESVDRGANSRCVLENNGRLNLNWRLLGIDGDRAYIQKIPAYRNRKHRTAGSLENSDHLMNNAFWIGVYPGITPQMREYVAGVLGEFISRRMRQ